jgi:5-methylcytosine-specific restriction endonuclease McrA
VCGQTNLSTGEFCNGCGTKLKMIPKNDSGASRYIPADVRKAVYERDGGKCVRCGNTNALQYDHILPFSKGGASTVENLQLLCANCNSEKRDAVDG